MPRSMAAIRSGSSSAAGAGAGFGVGAGVGFGAGFCSPDLPTAFRASGSGVLSDLAAGGENDGEVERADLQPVARRARSRSPVICSSLTNVPLVLPMSRTNTLPSRTNSSAVLLADGRAGRAEVAALVPADEELGAGDRDGLPLVDPRGHDQAESSWLVSCLHTRGHRPWRVVRRLAGKPSVVRVGHDRGGRSGLDPRRTAS